VSEGEGIRPITGSAIEKDGNLMAGRVIPIEVFQGHDNVFASLKRPPYKLNRAILAGVSDKHTSHRTALAH
jgi:hypothetical protein